MANIKACPICAFLSSYDYAIDIEKCPHCGHELEDTGIELYLRPKKKAELLQKYRNNPQYDKYVEFRDFYKKEESPTLTTCPVCQGKVSSAAAACPHCGQPMNVGQVAQPAREVNVPKCPTCGSTKISKIGYLDRATSVGFWGLGSRKLGKTMKCNNCGHMW